MKSGILRAWLVAIIFTGGFCACGGGGGDPGTAASAADAGRLDLVAVPSAALGTSRLVRIYTPFGYTPQTKYPVLYIYHGSAGDQNSWMPRLGMNTRADQLIREKRIRPLIIVAPQMDTSYGAGGNETFVHQELIQYVDSHYSTDATRENRFIGGLSMGGFIALHNAFVHTELFSKVGGHSAYLYTNVPNAGIENPITTAMHKDLKSLQVYLDAGTSDHFNLVPTNETLFGILQSQGVPSENHPGPGGHDAVYWSGNVDNYLRFYAGI